MKPDARRRRTRRILAVALTTAISTLALSGVAYGYWTTTANGTGTASAGQARLSITTGDAPTGLYPGGPAATVRVTLTNTGVGALNVASMTPSVSSSKSGCTAPGELTLTRLDPLPAALTPGSPASVSYTVAMATDADLACIGATFTLTFDAAGTVG